MALARIVAARLGGDVRLTRTGDENPTLVARAGTARDSGARVFLSLHANRGARGVRGSEAWVHPRGGGGSIALARTLLGSLGQLRVPDQGIKAADMYLLRPQHHAPGAAACLLEVDYLSDPEGERRLRDPAALAKLGGAIADGVRSFLANGEASRRRSRGLDTDWCAIRQSIIQTAVGEETFWTRADGTPHEESDPDMLDQLRAYWRDGVGASDWSTKATRSAQNLESWSAAFVSWVLRTAGVPAGAGFTFSGRHLIYIVDALRNREASDRSKPFWFYGIDEQDQAQPKAGDIICMNRGGSHFTYSSLRSAFLGNNAEPRGETHCNIVVDTRERDGRKFLVVIGGNRALPNSAHPDDGVTVRSSDEIEVDDSGVILAPADNRIFGIIALVGC